MFVFVGAVLVADGISVGLEVLVGVVELFCR